jgi:preprotein translocase subunit SecA
MRHAAIEDLVSKHVPENAYPEQWDVKALDRDVRDILTLALPLRAWAKEDGITAKEVRERITRVADQWMAGKDEKFGTAGIRHMQRMIVLHALDQLWREHLLTLNNLRRAIGWRGYARRQPLTEYRTDAFHLFDSMLQRLATVVTALSMRVGIISN